MSKSAQQSLLVSLSWFAGGCSLHSSKEQRNREFALDKGREGGRQGHPATPCTPSGPVALALRMLQSTRSWIWTFRCRRAETGRLRRGRKEFDDGRGPGSRQPRPCL